MAYTIPYSQSLFYFDYKKKTTYEWTKHNYHLIVAFLSYCQLFYQSAVASMSAVCLPSVILWILLFAAPLSSNTHPYPKCFVSECVQNYCHQPFWNCLIKEREKKTFCTNFFFLPEWMSPAWEVTKHKGQNYSLRNDKLLFRLAFWVIRARSTYYLEEIVNGTFMQLSYCQLFPLNF